MFYNWYDPATGAKLTHLAGQRRPGPPVPVQRRQRLAGHRAAASPRAPMPGAGRARPTRSASEMDFGCYYNGAEGSGRTRDAQEPWRPDPRRLLGRPAAGMLRSRATTAVTRRRLVHLPPLRRLQHRAADGVLPRHRRRARSRRALLRHCRTFPPTLRLVLDRDEADRRVAASTRASTSSRARCPTAAWTSCRPGAAACSRR